MEQYFLKLLIAVANGYTHKYYDKTIEYSNDYKIALTGNNFGDWLKRFWREKDIDFTKRKELTSENVSAIFDPVFKKFNRISRVQNVKRSIDYVGDSSEMIQNLILYIEGSFFSGGIENYLDTFYYIYSLADPNAFFLTDIKKVGDKKIPVNYIYPCESVRDFNYDVFGNLEYVIVKNKNSFGTYDYVLYSKDYFMKLTEVAKKNEDNNIFPTNQKFVTLDENFTVLKSGELLKFSDSKMFEYTVDEIKISNCQAFRVGYKYDIACDNKICISPIHRAIRIAQNVLSLKSNFDISFLTNIFPKMAYYIPPCKGTLEHPCIGGHTADGEICRVCDGTGKRKTFTTPEDSFELVLPDDAEEMIDLEKLLHYYKTEIDTVKALGSQITSLEQMIYVIVFSTELIPHANVTSIGDGVTATEFTVKRDDMNDTLFPCAQQRGLLRSHMVNTALQFFVPQVEYVKTTYSFVYPKDLKLSTLSELLDDLQKATQSNAPSFLIQELIHEIAMKKFDGDSYNMKKFLTKSAFVPFLGYTHEQVITLIDKGLVSEEDAYCWANSDVIFASIEKSEPDFYNLDYKLKNEIFERELKKFIAVKKFQPKI